jgi:hypothetical protein
MKTMIPLTVTGLGANEITTRRLARTAPRHFDDARQNKKELNFFSLFPLVFSLSPPPPVLY